MTNILLGRWAVGMPGKDRRLRKKFQSWLLQHQDILWLREFWDWVSGKLDRCWGRLSYKSQNFIFLGGVFMFIMGTLLFIIRLAMWLDTLIPPRPM